MEYRNRAQWGATYNVNKRALMTGLPVATIYIHHTVTVPSNNPNRDMQQVENIDIQRFGIPSYSWVIHPSGVALEGMGIHRGAHTINNANQSQNNIAFGLSFIGNFENDQPTNLAMQACGEVIRDIIKPGGWLRPNWAIKGHRDVYATACPGKNLYPRIGEIKAIADSGTPAPSPEPTPQEDDIVVLHIIKGPNTPEWWLSDLLTWKRWLGNPNEAAQCVFLTVKGGGKITHDGNNGPTIVEQHLVDSLKRVD